VQVVLFSKHANRVLLISGIVELILNIGLSLWLMQYFGLAGIAGATVIAYFVNKIILFLYSKQRYQLKLSDILPVRAYVLWSMVLIFCFIISMQYGWVL
jgi:Na+-driven multidrug efflux pump